MAHWTTLFSHVSGRLEIRKLCNFCGSSSSWGQIQAVSCSWCFHCFICEFIKCLLFFLKFFLQTNQKGTLQSDLRLGSWMSHAPLKTVGVDFICFVSSTELTSCQHHVREDFSLLRWHGGAKELVTIFLSARLSSSSQFCSTNVLADDSEVWPWLWHVTCTLETIFSTLKKKKKKKKCDNLYTVTCQDNDRLRCHFGAGSPLLLLPPLQPARPGEFQWTLSLGCTES